MINSDRKELFIESYTSKKGTDTYIKSVFGRFTKYESMFEKDLCEFSDEEMQLVFDENFGLNTRSISTALVIIKGYIDWCKNKDIITTDSIYSVKIKTENKIINGMVYSPKDMLRRLNETFLSPQDCTIEVLYRTYLWMAYFGIRSSDAVKLTADNIDIGNMVIHYNGINFDICEEALEDIKYVVDEDSFVTVHYNPYYESVRKRYPGNEIFCGIKNVLSEPRLRECISRLMSESNSFKFSYVKIYKSGLFYRMKKREDIGFDIDFSAVVKYDMEGKEYKTPLRQKAYLIDYDYKKEYQKWREVFKEYV